MIFFLVCAGFTVLGIATGHYLWKDPAGWEGQSVAMGKSMFLGRSAAPSSEIKSHILDLYITTENRLFLPKTCLKIQFHGIVSSLLDRFTLEFIWRPIIQNKCH